MKRNFFVFILYGILSLFFLREILLSSGIIIGSDWSLPLTLEQIGVFGRQGFFTWNNNTFGTRAVHLNAYFFSFFISLLPKIGIEGAVFSKILLVFLFTLIGFSSFYFCRKIGLSFKSSLLAGFIYMTTPLVFNYSIMGWIFVLLVMVIIPFFLLAFKLSVEKERVGYSIIAGLLFAIAMFQSQAVFWLPLLMIISFPFLVFSKRRLFLFVRSFLIIFFIVLAVHANWIFPLVFSLDREVVRTVSTYDIGRFETRLSFLNMVRLWGGLFNYQFETVYPKFLLPISFVLPMLAFLALILRRKDKKILHLAAITLLPLAIYSLRSILYQVPFSNIIRDFSRMMILSAFPYSVLVAITLEEIGKLRGKFVSKLLCVVVILLVLLNSLPFWTGELYGESRIDHDQRLRTLEFPRGYQEAEEFLLRDQADTKALWLPSGMSLGFLDNKKFYGPYKEAVDIFALLSQKPGAFAFSDKTTGLSVDYGKLILNTIKDSKITEFRNLLKLTSINNFVVRKNAYGAGGEGPEIEKTIEKFPGAINVFDESKVSIYQNTNFFPHFYIPQRIIYSNGGIENLGDIVGFEDYPLRLGIFKEENGNLLNGANEIFVKGELEGKVNEKDLEEFFTFNIGSVPFPYVRQMPGSSLYPLVLKKEQFDEWRVRNDPEKLWDKKLFYAGKRISEIERWGEEMDLDKAFERYETKMEEAITLLKENNWQDERALLRDILKTGTYLEAHWEKIKSKKFIEDKREKIQGIFEEMNEEVKNLKTKYISSQLIYTFEVPKNGDYQLLIKNEEFSRYLRDPQLVVDILGEKTTIPFPSENEDWISGGSFNLERGEKELGLTKPQTINLLGTDNWRDNLTESIFVKNEMITAPNLQLAFTEDSTPYFKPIENYQGDTFYKIAFDYFASGGEAGIAVIEDIGIKRRELKIKEKLFITSINSPRHFEKIFQSRAGAKTAEFYFWGKTETNEDSKIELFNVKIERVFEPTIILHTTQPQESLQMPKITFIKINPTKYKIKVEGAEEPYTLVFSESFDEGWKAYISNQQSATSNQQYGETVASYFDGEIKEGTHKNIFLEGNTFETWGKKSLSEDKHLLVNGYANSWYITPEDSNGKEDYEIIIEFWPQRSFYIGLGISLMTLLGCLGYLGYDFAKKKIGSRK